MSLQTALQTLESEGVNISSDYGTWLYETNRAFQQNYATDQNIGDV